MRASSSLRFSEDGLKEYPDIRIAGGVLIKRAVGADPMAKGDVDVDDQIT